jgi:hypothetical protein
MSSVMEEPSENIHLELVETEESEPEPEVSNESESPKTPASESGVIFDSIYPETETFETLHPESSVSVEPTPEVVPVSTPTVSAEPTPEVVPEPSIPKMVFVIPYRDREKHLSVFLKQMEIVLEDIPSSEYEMFVVHQVDSRAFNRGAVKNIGFFHVKDKYPNHYRDMTLVFNDVDTFPKIKNHFHYKTIPGVIKHFCGFTYALGGIVCINAGDFERLNGFPNFWAWGFEDNMLQHRVQKARIHIDRTNFVDFTQIDIANNPYIASLPSGITRTTNREEFMRYLSNTNEGLRQIRTIHRETDSSKYPISPITDTTLKVESVNITYFDCGTAENEEKRQEYDLRTGRVPFGNVIRRRGMAMPAIPMHL